MKNTHIETDHEIDPDVLRMAEIVDKYKMKVTGLGDFTSDDGWKHTKLSVEIFNPETPDTIMSVDYRTGMAWKYQGLELAITDVFYSLASDASLSDGESFDDFCGYLGCSNNSIKALRIYEQCIKQTKELKILLEDDYDFFVENHQLLDEARDVLDELL